MNVRTIRLRLGITQTELAAELGVTHQAVCQRELGRARRSLHPVWERRWLRAMRRIVTRREHLLAAAEAELSGQPVAVPGETQ